SQETCLGTTTQPNSSTERVLRKTSEPSDSGTRNWEALFFCLLSGLLPFLPLPPEREKRRITGVRSQKSKVKGQKSKVGRQDSGFRCQVSGVGCQVPGVGSQKAKGKRQKSKPAGLGARLASGTSL